MHWCEITRGGDIQYQEKLRWLAPQQDLLNSERGPSQAIVGDLRAGMQMVGLGRAEAERSGKGGQTEGLSEGVLAADNRPLSNVITPREASGSEGDGTDTEASGLPASASDSEGDGTDAESSGLPAPGELRVHCFPFPLPLPLSHPLPLALGVAFLTFASAAFFCTCLRQYAMKYSLVNWWQSVLPVSLFRGMWLHP